MQLVGILGIDPAPYSIRELVLMNCAKQRSDWGRTAAVNQMIYWANKAKNAPSKSIADFNPWIEKKEAEIGTRELYQLICSGQPRRHEM